MRKSLAGLTSTIMNPFLVSFAVIILLAFVSTSSTSEALKWASISIALSVLPVFGVVIYLVRIHKLESISARVRQQRNKIYLLASTLAVVGFIVLLYLGAPRLLVAVFVAGLAAMVLFMGINFWWKISLHTGFVAASVTILAIVYNPVGAWTVLLLPPVAWARTEAGHHSLAQVAGGALLAAVVVVVVFQLFGLIGSAGDV